MAANTFDKKKKAEQSFQSKMHQFENCRKWGVEIVCYKKTFRKTNEADCFLAPSNYIIFNVKADSQNVSSTNVRF